MSPVAQRQRVWYETEAELRALSALPDGLSLGAVDSGRTFTYDAVHGLIPDTISRVVQASTNTWPLTVTNSAAQFEIGSFSITGGALGSNGILRMICYLAVKNNTGGDQTVDFSFGPDPDPFGDAVLFTSPALPDAGGLSAFRFGTARFEVVNNGDDGSPYNSFECGLGRKNAEASGPYTAGGFPSGSGYPATIADQASDWTVRLDAQMSTASANFTVEVWKVALETVFIH